MIKTIIFDFGDVFLTLDKSATTKHLKKQGISELDSETLKINESYEKGLISSNEFIQHYTEKFDGLSDEKFKKAWNSILIDFPLERLDFLKKLKTNKAYKIILLSNTNELHIDWVKEHVSVFEEFKSCFDRFYLSHEINFRKPDKSIFEFVLKKNDLKPEETLFIDDTLEHILTAQQLGIHTWHLKAGQEEVSQLFSKKTDLF
ncbi:HAD family hydrolase [Psychroflexus sediminis]|uniref:Putative hydrolase of the HAD superfamily n=1 Tax=Psychroflexus sediminis TaxID=470826 RepID=A0A1G7VQY0_9FLAO|nr:HAD family phosphatase [Psychroflexus sediminis]SDG62222.1 putative hydrolase of the HAD superfamily [Psychroflexus sediminis]